MNRAAQALILSAKAGEIPPKLDPAGFPDLGKLRAALAGDTNAALELRTMVARYDRWAAAPALPDKIRVAFRWNNGAAYGEGETFAKAMAIAVVNLWGMKQ